MPSLSCCGVMKRKSNGVGVMEAGEEDEEQGEKRSRLEENGAKENV